MLIKFMLYLENGTRNTFNYYESCQYLRLIRRQMLRILSRAFTCSAIGLCCFVDGILLSYDTHAQFSCLFRTRGVMRVFDT